MTFGTQMYCIYMVVSTTKGDAGSNHAGQAHFLYKSLELCRLIDVIPTV